MRLLARSALGAVAILALAQCEPFDDKVAQVEEPAEEELAPPELAPEDQALRTVVAGRVISGEPLDAEDILAILGRIIGDDRPSDIAEAIKILEGGGGQRGDFEEAPIDGLGGAVLQVLLDALKLSLDQNQRFFQSITIEPKGQILDYRFNDEERTGYLDVVVWYEVTGSQTGPLPSPAYRYKVRVDRTIVGDMVESNGFSVLSSDITNPSDPFPNTVPITGLALQRIQQGDLEYKLWAEGTDIKILEVSFNPNFTPLDLSGFTVLDPNNALYRVTRSSCIDMMFQALPPPEMTPDFKVPFYCLGRCQSPMLINTK